MSYCVNCGVELAPSEPKCPLCGVEVINPANPWKEPKNRPYPDYFDTVMRGVDRRYFCLLAAVLGMIPVLICFLIDLFTSGDMTWSSYVLGAAIVLMVVILVPISAKRKVYRYLLYDLLAIAGYLLLIDYKHGGIDWFFTLAFPITVSFGIIAALNLLYYYKRKSGGILLLIALMLIGTGVFTVSVEFFMKLHLQQPLMPVWSWYALVPCILSGVAFIILNRRNKWKESVRKRLFL